jgi:hypothetical protein
MSELLQHDFKTQLCSKMNWVQEFWHGFKVTLNVRLF